MKRKEVTKLPSLCLFIKATLVGSNDGESNIRSWIQIIWTMLYFIVLFIMMNNYCHKIFSYWEFQIKSDHKSPIILSMISCDDPHIIVLVLFPFAQFSYENGKTDLPSICSQLHEEDCGARSKASLTRQNCSWMFSWKTQFLSITYKSSTTSIFLPIRTCPTILGSKATIPWPFCRLSTRSLHPWCTSRIGWTIAPARRKIVWMNCTN